MAVPKHFPALAKAVPELLEILCFTGASHRSAIGRDGIHEQFPRVLCGAVVHCRALDVQPFNRFLPDSFHFLGGPLDSKPAIPLAPVVQGKAGSHGQLDILEIALSEST
jgi:hypothetical protein